MTASDHADPAPASPPQNSMPKVAFASFMGTVIEFYDFGIYGTAAALVFASTFFPALGTTAGTVVSFATLGIAFAARPLGAIIFGHFGDRLGRKRTLIATMALMGAATVLIGLLPPASAIGVAAPIILVVLRIAQGIAAGGEWGGAALFTSENSPPGRRGFWAMFTNLGGAVANILALVTFLITGLYMSNETFAAWGWRVPFLLSVLLVAVGLYVRLKLEETPVFAKEVVEHGRSRLPIKEAFVSQWRTILAGGGTLLTAFAFGYMGIAYLTNYGTATLGFGRTEVFAAGVFGNVVNGLCIISGGLLSDRIGRKRVLLFVNVAGIPWAFLLFPILNTQSQFMFFVCQAVTFIIAGHGFGVAGSFLSELFHTRYRYTAAGLAYSIVAAIGGGVPPLLAAAIIPTYGSFAFGFVLGGYAVVALLCTLGVRETQGEDFEDLDREALARVEPDRSREAA
jgi:MFS family permease